MNRLAHIPKADLYRVYDAFLRGLAAMTAKVEIYSEPIEPPKPAHLTGAHIARNIPRLASIGPSMAHRPRGSWVMMLCEVGVDGAASPVAYLRHDGTVHGMVRDYSVEHINNLSLLVGNGDVLTVEVKRDEQGNVMRAKPIWRWGEGSYVGGGREVSTHDYLTISAPLMTQVYRLTKTPKTPGG